MMTIELLGAMDSLPVKRGLRTVTFEKGKPLEVADDLGQEMLGRNPDGLTVDQAAPYGIPVFKLHGARPEVDVAGVVPSDFE